MEKTKSTVTAVLVGYQLGLKRPQPLPGETLLQCVVRLFPREWQNFLERMEHGLTADARDRLARGIVGDGELSLGPEIDRFVRLRLPTFDRTLEDLAELKGMLAKPGGVPVPLAYIIDDVILPCATNLSADNDKNARALAARYGGRVLSATMPSGQTFDVGSIVSDVGGDFIWLVSGGTCFNPALTAYLLGKLIERFVAQPNLAAIFDYPYTVLLRREVVRRLVGQGVFLPANWHDMASLFRDRGCETDAVESQLVELEPFYGGVREGASRTMAQIIRDAAAQRPWWKRVLMPWRR